MSAVRVTLADAATNQVIGETNLAPEDLPESFALSTTMHLGSDDWNVDLADPIERADYVAAGRLRLVLRKVEMVDPREVLFSLRTLEDALPPLREGNAASAHPLHEDDWRQREFVAKGLSSAVAAELDDIRAINLVESGFRFDRVHIRSRIGAPLGAARLSVAAVRAAVGGLDPTDLAVGDALVVGGFAFPLAGRAVYGREIDGHVVALGIAGDADAPGLGALATEHDLILVDWLRAEVA